jgi:hypothetical protein
MLEYTGSGTPNFGTLAQFFAPGELRNKRLKFSASVRVPESPGCKAQLWFRTDLPDNARGYFYNMDDRPITSPEWKRYSFTAEVQENAVRVNLGMILVGACRAYVGDVSLEPIGVLEDP